MKIDFGWLKEYVKTELAPREVAALLGRAGLVVEALEGEGDAAVLHVEVTSNRGDCLSHIGIAREVAALTGATLAPPAASAPRGTGAAFPTPVTIDDPAGCSRYLARVARGVRVGPSPAWMSARLESAGVRPINNVVDVTNYVMLEWGQPLHAFDLRFVRGSRIVVRAARVGETIRAIDGKTYSLQAADLAICDAERPLAIAGVMGGAESEIRPDTTDLLLESAHFDPSRIRRTSRRLRLASESSYRFERGVSWEAVERASERAASLLAEVAGATIAPGCADVVARPALRRVVPFRMRSVDRILGTRIEAGEVERSLRALGCEVERGADAWQVTVPWHRNDIEGEHDLIEEAARLHGYDKLPTDLRIPVRPLGPDPRHEALQTARRVLAGLGCQEVLTSPFTEGERDEFLLTHAPGAPVEVFGPSGKVERVLRRGLLAAVAGPLAAAEGAQTPYEAVFEIGTAYGCAGPDDYAEPLRVAVAARGDLRRLRGILDELETTLGGPSLAWSPGSHAWAIDGGADLAPEGGPRAGAAGVVTVEARSRFDLREEYAMAEIDFDAMLPRDSAGPVRIAPLLRQPAVIRDMAVVFPREVSWSAVDGTIRSVAGPCVEHFALFDVYEGKGILPGHRSLAFRLRFRHPDRTLTAEEVEAWMTAIGRALAERHRGVVRDAQSQP